MFSNRFNTKNDPLLEAVQNAMQDGEIRRQAEALVNEEFGVFNRRAVVREQLAAYDARLEEAYKCMKEAPDTGESDARKTVTSSKEAKEKVFAKHKERMKKLDDKPKADYSKMREKMVGKGKDLETTRKIVGEAKKLADKDYDKDGKVESPKDEVWGSRFRAAKMAGKMEEEQIDEISHKLALKAMKKSDERGEEEYDRDMTDDRLSDPKTHWDRAKRLRGHMKRKFGNKTIKTGGTDNLSPKSYEQGGGERRRADKLKKGPRAGMISARHRDKLKDNIKYSLGKHKKPNLPEEVDYSAPDRAAVTRDNKPSTPAQTNAATSGPSAADKAALTSKIKTMKEAVYSAKAARAGKNIGKPGKEFKKIAKSAAERYGSEERGKKVAGAILKRIRAKHMKEENLEELSAFGREFAAARKAGQTQFMSKVTGKMTSTALKGQTGSSSAPAPKAAPVDAPSPKSQTGSSRMDALKSITNPTPTVSKTQNMGSSISTGSSSAMDAVSALSAKQAATPGERTAPVNKMQNMGSSISTGGSSAMDKISSMGAAQSSDTQKSKDVARGVTSFAQQSSITGGIGAASNPKDSRNKFSVDESKALKESVQVGANKYRIV